MDWNTLDAISTIVKKKYGFLTKNIQKLVYLRCN